MTVVVQLNQATSLAAIAKRVYGLQATDPQMPAAEKGLAVANPHLTGALGALAPNTPVVVPTLPGVAMASVHSINPTGTALTGYLATLHQAAELASTAQQTGAATTPVTKPIARRTKALDTLGADIAVFQKLHASR